MEISSSLSHGADLWTEGQANLSQCYFSPRIYEIEDTFLQPMFFFFFFFNQSFLPNSPFILKLFSHIHEGNLIKKNKISL